MDNLHLILHKVRGEPAFDIAIPLQIGREEGWIIPTSGHRAYPFEAWPLAEAVLSLNGIELPNVTEHVDWDGWPEHYNTERDDRSYMEDEARTILLRKGLLKAKPVNNYRRR